MASNDIPPLQPGVDILTQADDAPLTSQMKNLLADRLAGDWKRFARGTELFSEAQIENIDAEEHNITEKCYDMLSQWSKNSIAIVTIGMTKLNLINIKRNDILLDVFEISQQTDPPNISPSQGASNIGVNSSSEPTVSNLLYKHIQQLSNLLDADRGVGMKSWKQLGFAVFQGDRDACDLVESLHLSYSGGGSPAKRFLSALAQRHPRFTVNQFYLIAVNYQRMDIATYIDSLGCPEEKPFRDLTFSQQERIINDLDKDIRGIADWRMFADYVGFTNNEITEIKQAVRERNEYSPTQSLIDLMRQRYPLLTLSKLQIAARSIGRNDVAHILDGIIQEAMFRGPSSKR